MSHVRHNNEITQAAIQRVKQLADAASVSGTEPRFDLWYEGFGAGGTAGATAEHAVRMLRDLAAADDPHYRYSTRIKFITITMTAKHTFS